MKFSVFALLVVVAGAFAMPEVDVQAREARIVANTIRNMVEQVSRFIIEIGLDPLDIESLNFEYVPVPFIAEVRASAENIHFSGLSNIVIEDLNYSALLNRLRFTFVLPQLLFSVVDRGQSWCSCNTIGLCVRYMVTPEETPMFSAADTTESSEAAIKGISLGGEVRVNIGIISGISIRSLSLDVNLGGIESDLVLNFLGEDYSDILNELLNDKIPSAFQENREEINRLLESVIRDILDQIL